MCPLFQILVPDAIECAIPAIGGCVIYATVEIDYSVIGEELEGERLTVRHLHGLLVIFAPVEKETASVGLQHGPPLYPGDPVAG